MAENNIVGFKKLMRYAQNLAEYEQGIAEGIIDDNVFVIVLEDKVAKFKGQTFDWSEGVDIDPSALATKDELAEAEEIAAAAYNDLNERINNLGGGSGGGSTPASSGPLRVWANSILGGENTAEQQSENAATFASMQNNAQPASVMAMSDGLTYIFANLGCVIVQSEEANAIALVIASSWENSIPQEVTVIVFEDGSIEIE